MEPGIPGDLQLLSRLLRLTREVKKKSQVQLARDSSVSAQAVNALESLESMSMAGRRTPDLPLLLRVCRYGLQLDRTKTVALTSLFQQRPSDQALDDLFGPVRIHTLPDYMDSVLPPSSSAHGGEPSDPPIVHLLEWLVCEGISGGWEEERVVIFSPDGPGILAVEERLKDLDSAAVPVLTWKDLPAATIVSKDRREHLYINKLAPGWERKRVAVFEQRSDALRESLKHHQRRAIFSLKGIESYLNSSNNIPHIRGPWKFDSEDRRQHIRDLVQLLRDFPSTLHVLLSDSPPNVDIHMASLEGAMLRPDPVMGRGSMFIPNSSQFTLLRHMAEFEREWLKQETTSDEHRRAQTIDALEGLLKESQ